VENSGESDERIILTTVASAIAGRLGLLMFIEGSNTWAVIATVCFFGVAVVGVLQLIFRHL